MKLPELFIARHGQTEWNLLHRMQGNLDSDLTELGQVQARQLGVILRQCVPDGVRYISSPQPRAVRTAELAMEGTGRGFDQDNRLREIEVGDWQGRLSQEIKAGLLGDTLTHTLHYYDFAPNGEKFAGLRQRCGEFLGELQGPTVIFTHGITSRMIRLIALGQGDDQLSDLAGGQGIVFHIKEGVQKILK